MQIQGHEQVEDWANNMIEHCNLYDLRFDSSLKVSASFISFLFTIGSLQRASTRISKTRTFTSALALLYFRIQTAWSSSFSFDCD
jgi:hypothetical protein